MMTAQTSKVSESPGTEDTRAKILKASVEAFAEHGFEGATVRDICRLAGVNGALVNYHFRNKLELYLAVIRHAVDAEAQTELVDRALKQNADPYKALRQIIHVMVVHVSATATDDAGLKLRLLLKEIANPTPALERIADETFRPMYDRLRALIGRILHLPADHEKTRLCVHSILGQVTHYAHARPILRQLWPEMKLSEEQVAMVGDHIAEFSLASLRAMAAKSPIKTVPKASRRRK